ncbi:MAG TPA: hypothetical protein VKG38_04330 [Solirubrobacteraceae bacterium]|nr:hypothetical protein [Solirubrobacteraceae bacterium]
MEGQAGNSMDGETQVERAVMPDPLPNAQRLQPPCGPAGGDEVGAVRARLTAAAGEIVAENSSNPRLVGTRHTF